MAPQNYALIIYFTFRTIRLGSILHCNMRTGRVKDIYVIANAPNKFLKDVKHIYSNILLSCIRICIKNLCSQKSYYILIIFLYKSYLVNEKAIHYVFLANIREIAHVYEK